jgi:heptosyltransferase II
MEIRKILFITLSNIGDAILTLPSLDYIRERLYGAKITVMAGSRTKELFEGNPFIEKVIVYEKKCSLGEQIKFFFDLKKENFDMVVDLRNSLFGALLPVKYRISPFLRMPAQIKHMKERHLYKVKNLLSKILPEQAIIGNETTFFISPPDKAYIKDILHEFDVYGFNKFIVVASGARSDIKKWPGEKFAELARRLIEEFGGKIFIVGDGLESKQVALSNSIDKNIIDLRGKTTLAQLAYLLERSRFLITNDSATLHLGSYLNLPVLGIFGPTDAQKYGPWSDSAVVVKKQTPCSPCENAQCGFGTKQCMNLITVDDVLAAVRKMLFGDPRSSILDSRNEFKRILIVRTDRIGDVLLSTPAIKALRQAYPSSFIAMMVSPYSKEIVEGNPYLDEVIVYDKDRLHKGWFSSMKFTRELKKKRFELALILHPGNRQHMIAFFAGIHRRLGYGRKMGFLLTDRIKHLKQLGEKHESEYALDLVRFLGIEPGDNPMFMPVKAESEEWARNFLRENNISDSDKLLAVHPGASCPSKRWPGDRFAQVADKLAERFGFKVLILAGPGDLQAASSVSGQMHSPAINLGGKTSVSQLASILKRCGLFISNDSGPVHMACALGVPVISIFGRSQAGLSPRRWGPQGANSRILHKEVGCRVCLAHNCAKGLLCLKAITAEDVLAAAEDILKSQNKEVTSA